MSTLNVYVSVDARLIVPEVTGNQGSDGRWQVKLTRGIEADVTAYGTADTLRDAAIRLLAAAQHIDRLLVEEGREAQT